MVLGILTSIAACPAIIGTTEAVRQGQTQNRRQSHRSRKSNLLVTCSDPSSKARDIHGGTVVLRDKKFYVTTVNPKARYGFNANDDPDPDRLEETGHLFAGYFFPYPDRKWGRRGDGYVTTISDDPPQLNWVYVDKDTHEVKYGLRAEAEDHIVGPWNCSPVDRRLTFDGWEGFTVVEVDSEEGSEGSNTWQLYFDVDDDGLESIGVPLDKRIMEIELTRKEMRMRKGDSILG